jgi:tripartite-type tricarboxylate transporter receptor subunit TctC
MSTITRRAAAGLLASATLAAASGARGQSWPDRRITFVNGAPAGSAIDFVARVMGEQLAQRLGQPVVVENRPGASFNLATLSMIRAPADGYTLGFAPITMSTNPSLIDIGYDPLKDVTMVTQISSLPVVVVIGKHRPWRTLKEMVEHGRANPGDVTLGHGGQGTSGFLAAQLFARAAGFEPRMLPYRGTAPVFNDMLSGSVDGTFTPVDGTIKGHVEAGSMRVLAVMQEKRIALMPDVPTTREQGYGPEVDFRSWHGLMLRAGTPQPIVDRYFAEAAAIMRQPEVTRRLIEAGIEPAPSASQAEFVAFYENELQRMGKLIRDLGIPRQ